MKKKEKKGGKLMIRHASRFDVFLSMLIMLEVSQVNGGMRIIDQGSRLTVYSLRKWCFHVSWCVKGRLFYEWREREREWLTVAADDWIKPSCDSERTSLLHLSEVWVIKSRAGSVEREILPVRGGLQGWMNQCAVSHAQKMSSLII